MYEALMLLAFAAFVALAAHYVQKLEDKDDADDYDIRVPQDDRQGDRTDENTHCTGTTGCGNAGCQQGAGRCHS